MEKTQAETKIAHSNNSPSNNSSNSNSINGNSSSLKRKNTDNPVPKLIDKNIDTLKRAYLQDKGTSFCLVK